MTTASDNDDTTTFKVVANDEDQYSIWPAGRPNPPGWRDVGVSGTKSVCLARIDEIWVDMRPRSLREAMAHAAAETQPEHEDRHAPWPA
jgi:MbtH protein